MSFMMMMFVVLVVVEVEIGNDEVVGVVPNHSIYEYRYVEMMMSTTQQRERKQKSGGRDERGRLCLLRVCALSV